MRRLMIYCAVLLATYTAGACSTALVVWRHGDTIALRLESAAAIIGTAAGAPRVSHTLVVSGTEDDMPNALAAASVAAAKLPPARVNVARR